VIDLYTSLMTHDAGNDLQAVLGYLELSLSRCQDCKQDVIEVLEAARVSAIRMTSLIKAFKTSELDSGGTLVQLLEKISEQAETAHIGLKTSIEVQSGLETVAVAGDALLAMALANLLRNSADYAGSNPVVNIELSKKDDCVVLLLSDNGPGIPLDKRNNIFQRGASILDHGMGLYLTKQIVVACQGTIDFVDSENGASFRIVLPIIQ
jgi:signal transduction histidine kinase